MKERKYKGQYKLHTEMDEKGREKRVAVYQGDYYALDLTVEAKRAFFKRSLIVLAVFAVLYMAYLCLASPSSYCIYVLPFASAAMAPLVYCIMGMVSMLRAPQKMTSVQKEKGIGRVMRSFLGCMVLLFLASLGDLILMIRSQNANEEMIGFALLVCAAVTAVAGFRQTKEVYNHIRVISGGEGKKNG